MKDLLDEKCSGRTLLAKGSKFAGSAKLDIRSSEEAKRFLEKGNQNRHFRATFLNATSSRSHTVCSIFVETRTESKRIGAVAYLVDLACNESIRHNDQPAILQEIFAINNGLLTLGRVVNDLAKGKSLIPYRYSILTAISC